MTIKQMKTFEGKVAVITGGNSGIGLATAKKFASQGAKVAISGRDSKTLDQAMREVGPDTLAVQSDVTDLASLDRLFQQVKDKFGKIDVLFVNAGVAKFVPVDEVTVQHYDELMNTNLKGAYFTIQKALPLLNDGGAVILTTTAANRMGLPNSSVYSASKAALRSLARTFSAELIGRGIRVNAVSPGPIETPIFGRLGMTQEEVGELAKVILGRVPAKRLGIPDEIANAVLFLASPESTYIIGAELNVDGGMTQL
jgi:NAD(P)-dependent dehydrogenase (short-subunit alcohol dehydrogenase family)